MNPHDERYYYRVCRDAVARKPADLDMEEMWPFEDNESYNARTIWNEVAYGIKRVLKNGKAVNPESYKYWEIDIFIDKNGFNDSSLSRLVGLHRWTIERIRRGDYPYMGAVNKLRKFMDEYERNKK